ncbi:MAG: helix-hairpin-helix domain-containing protein [Candidatus Saccharibacteria bacterium]
MNFRQIVQDYFTFSRNERKGITILLVLIFLLALANKIIFYFETPAKIDIQLLNAQLPAIKTTSSVGSTKGSLFAFNPNTIEKKALDSLALPDKIKSNLIRYRDRGGHYYSAKDFRKMYGMTDSIYTIIEPYVRIETEVAPPLSKKISRTLFDFNPNTASDSIFLCLGITEKQIRTIRNYQNKGGHFYSAADWLKVYSISESQKKELLPYIKIEKEGFSASDKRFALSDPLIEINSSDSVELMKLPGIGTKLSKRIIKYRDLLGGYYTADQLREVYGLKEETIDLINKRIKVDGTKIKKVDLNFSDRYELARHPYIGKDNALLIVNFRTKYGFIANPSVLKDSLILTKDNFERLKPYL